MAKTTKGGLGRGLSTLMGGSFEESSSHNRQPERTHVTVEPGEIPAYDPILEPAAIRSKTPSHPSDTDKTSNVDHESSKAVSSTTKEEAPKSTPPVSNESPATSSLQKSDISTKEISEKTSVTSDDSDINSETDEPILMIDIEAIEPNPHQPRTSFNKEEMEELAASIDREGVLQPIIVRRVDKGKYQIIAGERRWQASKMAGLTEIPVILKDVTEDKAIELALIENLQRSDLNPIEEAYGYRRLMDRKRWTQAQLALAMSKGRSTIANALRLLDLPESAQQLLFEEKISAGHARAILSVSSQEGRERLTEKLKEEKLSVRETENIARLMNYSGKQKTSSTRATIPDSYKRVAKALRDVLNTTVRVRSSKGKNSIEIDFTDQSELDRIFDSLVNMKE